MNSSRPQQTIARPARIQGSGYWSGQPAEVIFQPAAADTGIVFVRTDIDVNARIPASVTHRIETPRRTTIEHLGVRVEMIEHIMAALAGLAIDNCEVWTSAAELPAGDGSCQLATTALLEAGVVQQDAVRRAITIQAPCRVGDENAWIEATPHDGRGLLVDYQLDYGEGNSIGKQQFALAISPESFVREIAPARTFVLEAEAIRFQQLGYGRNITYKDILVFGDQGPLDNTLRFANECVRHKILDLVGDLAMTGIDIHGQITAYRSGHHLNARLAETLVATEATRLPCKMTV